ncbi:hypothetical protein GEV33_001280 [Tenebrio molitor]|uniref:Uncharacterized protein n=1 Tax=Tenebrio molitor TaxID=7067 RepID=A0A8J6LQC8_TENMO|nr:hypothetical protein GEV33_001280 [Tenebrio molitor]
MGAEGRSGGTGVRTRDLPNAKWRPRHLATVLGPGSGYCHSRWKTIEIYGLDTCTSITTTFHYFGCNIQDFSEFKTDVLTCLLVEALFVTVS